MRRARAIVIALVIVVVLSIAGTLGFLIYRPQATLDGDYRLLGLDARGEIVRDVWGVAHVYASTPHDLFYLQGYATAQDRLFQLDLFRRTGRGRLAEVLGEPGLETDKFMTWNSNDISFPKAGGVDWHRVKQPLLLLQYTEVNQDYGKATILYPPNMKTGELKK